ncbi:MAG: ATP synthase F1 subunit epsilon [Sarcina sp.]
MKVFNLVIATPEDIIYEGEVKSLKAKTSFGEFQMYSEHEPFVASIRPYKLTIVDKDQKRIDFITSEGMLETKGDSVIICLNSVELIEEVDIERAKQSFERATQRLLSKDYKLDKIRAKNALDRAKVRISTVQ